MLFLEIPNLIMFGGIEISLGAGYHAISYRSCHGSLMKLQHSIIFIIFWDIFMFYQVFLSPQVKQSTIISQKHGLYELPQEFQNNLRLRILEN